MKFVVLLVVLIGLSADTFAQTKKFMWDDVACRYESVYDAKKYSETQLRNTVRLFSVSEFGIDADATAWKFEDIEKLSVEALTEEYERETADLKALKIVKVPYFEALRQKKLAEMEQVYRTKRATIAAYTNPKVLADVKFAASCVQKYANPLINGGDDLLNIWQTVNEDSRARNGSPENVKRIFDEQMRSPDRLKLARVEVMSFGWWNCANDFIEYVQHDGKSETEFKKLFRKTRTIDCEEP